MFIADRDRHVNSVTPRPTTQIQIFDSLCDARACYKCTYVYVVSHDKATEVNNHWENNRI